MAISTYTELKSTIANWLNRSDLTSEISDDFIKLVEADLNAKLRIRQMEQIDTITIDSETEIVPTGFIAVRSFYILSGGTKYHLNYITPIPSSMYVDIKKKNAVGQSAYKVNLPIDAPITTKNYYPSGVRSTIRRVRSGGCVAPKKKGAIENQSLRNGAVCGWGSIVRQNY